MIKRGKTAVVEPASHYRRTTLSTLRLLRGRDHVSLRYEALVKDPEAALQRVMPLLGLDYEPSQLDWAAAERHNLGGNRMRRTASSDIVVRDRSEEHTSELQSLMRRSYAVLCLKKKTK